MVGQVFMCDDDIGSSRQVQHLPAAIYPSMDPTHLEEEAEKRALYMRRPYLPTYQSTYLLTV